MLFRSAVAAGSVEVLELLLSRGALVDGPAFAVTSPLFGAASQGHLAAARFLVERGADVDRDNLHTPLTPLALADELSFLRKGQAEVAAYLRSVGATKPWDYNRPDGFWNDAFGYLTLLFVESCLGLTHATPVGVLRNQLARIEIRRALHGWRTIFQTLYSAGLTLQGGHCEVGVCLTQAWPLHRGALKELRFRRPVDFLIAVSERILQGATPAHGDVLGRQHDLVRGLDWPGEFEQWLVVRHESFETRRREIGDPMLPVMLLLIPHLDKRSLKQGKDALAIADRKANVKWEKPAAGGGRNNLVVPLCYDGAWLGGKWY